MKNRFFKNGVFLTISVVFLISNLSCMVEETSINNRYLLLDSRIVNSLENAILELGTVEKDKNNPLFGEEYWSDKPKTWEARFDNLYPNVIFDEDDKLFKIWYKSFVRDASSETIPVNDRPNHQYSTAGAGRQRGILYAFSENGINWVKPNLNLVEFMGSTQNNIVKLNFEGGVFKDNFEKDPNKRFKMFGRIDKPISQMAVSFSKDGVNWDESIPWPNHNVHGDAHNNAIWSPVHNKYVGITRTFDNKIRTVVRTESDDFVNWTEPVEILRGEGSHAQIYSMPIFYYANVFIGFPSIFKDDDTVDTELAWSSDTKNWHRILPGKSLIPRGSGLENYPLSDFDAGCIYASVPVITDEEVLIYYGGSNYLHTDWRETFLGLARMRLDGFAGFEVIDDSENGIIKTNLFRVLGNELRINADILDGGSLKVTILNEKGEVIPGFDFEACESLPQKSIDALVTWKDKSFSELKGQNVAFQISFNNSKVYSLSGNFQFIE